MKKILIIISSLIALSTYAQNEVNKPGYEINGIIKNAPDSSMVKLIRAGRDQKLIDSAFTIGEKFQFKGNVDSPTYFYLAVRDNRGFKSIWIENNKMTFTADIKNLKEAKITGSSTQKEADILMNQIMPYDMLYDSLVTIARTEGIEQNYSDSIIKVLREVRNKTTQVTLDFLREHPNSIVSLSTLDGMKSSLNKEVLIELFALTNEQSKQSRYGKSITYFLEININPQVGDHYVDFELKNTNEKLIKLSDIKGKYVLIDFWASWCSPCRQESPYLVKAYSKYKKLGFEILGISNDSKKENWIKAINADSLNWENESSLTGGADDANIIYSITGIPCNYLIDEDGIIIARNLRGDELEQKLEELFK